MGRMWVLNHEEFKFGEGWSGETYDIRKLLPDQRKQYLEILGMAYALYSSSPERLKQDRGLYYTVTVPEQVEFLERRLNRDDDFDAKKFKKDTDVDFKVICKGRPRETVRIRNPNLSYHYKNVMPSLTRSEVDTIFSTLIPNIMINRNIHGRPQNRGKHGKVVFITRNNTIYRIFKEMVIGNKIEYVLSYRENYFVKDRHKRAKGVEHASDGTLLDPNKDPLLPEWSFHLRNPAQLTDYIHPEFSTVTYHDEKIDMDDYIEGMKHYSLEESMRAVQTVEKFTTIRTTERENRQRISAREARDMDINNIDSQLETIRHQQVGMKNKRNLKRLERQEEKLLAIKDQLKSDNFFFQKSRPKKRFNNSYRKKRTQEVMDDYKNQ